MIDTGSRRYAEKVNRWRSILAEVKSRVAIIDHFCSDTRYIGLSTPDHSSLYQAEICSLQIRMICELIAFGLLNLHEDHSPTGDTYSAYQADKILTALDRVHAEYYPRPSRQATLPDGSMHIHEVTENFLSKEDLKEIYISRLEIYCMLDP